MSWQQDDTIAALASPAGSALRGIVRLSGPAVFAVLSEFFQPEDAERWKTARLPFRHRGVLLLPGWNEPLRAAVYFWPTTRSYTGQPLAEIHTVGSPPLLEALQAALYSRGIRPAQPGEFTLRAFLSGRLDLVQAEAVMGVVNAPHQPALKQALQQLGGGVSAEMVSLQTELLDLLAEIEAGLDFVEEDIRFLTAEEIARRLQKYSRKVEELQQQAVDRLPSEGRIRIVLAGLPNAGKSSLFNALVGQKAALVSAQSGTTRDYLRAELDWNGLPVELIDTAGQSDDNESDTIAAAAQHFRKEQLGRADVVVWCTAADLPPRCRQEDQNLFQSCQGRGPVVRLLTKGDLVAEQDVPAADIAGSRWEEILSADSWGGTVSVRTGAGLVELPERLLSAYTRQSGEGAGWLGSTVARCRGSLSSAQKALSRAVRIARQQEGDDLIAVEVREAVHCLGEILGTVYTDDILDRIFSKFCIGK